MKEANEIRTSAPQPVLSIPCHNWHVDPRATIVIARPRRLLLPTTQYNSMSHLERLLEYDFALPAGPPRF